MFFKGLRGNFRIYQDFTLAFNDEGVTGRLHQLWSVVGGGVGGEGCVNLPGLDAEVTSDGNSGQDITEVVFSDKLGLHGMLPGTAGFAPAEGEEGRVARDASADGEFLAPFASVADEV